ncbi:hypothetical protein BDN72DRAFT_862651 [Pluteus cervinus]|uniref:Uncharacterized protein n=1 Tax=Pluteus cervinus TaxID=181527 RepID=A0ACD3ABK8_9AGAR|nr:hypothetical protein BDN72DRAFT_862651 [Pluteus cervinus]
MFIFTEHPRNPIRICSERINTPSLFGSPHGHHRILCSGIFDDRIWRFKREDCCLLCENADADDENGLRAARWPAEDPLREGPPPAQFAAIKSINFFFTSVSCTNPSPPKSHEVVEICCWFCGDVVREELGRLELELALKVEVEWRKNSAGVLDHKDDAVSVRMWRLLNGQEH